MRRAGREGSPDECSLTAPDYITGLGGCPKARPTASAFDLPVTRNNTSGAEQSTGKVIVTRSTNGSSFASAGIARGRGLRALATAAEHAPAITVRIYPEWAIAADAFALHP